MTRPRRPVSPFHVCHLEVRPSLKARRRVSLSRCGGCGKWWAWDEGTAADAWETRGWSPVRWWQLGRRARIARGDVG